MSETSQCVLNRLGEDAELHEQIKKAIDESFIRTELNGYPTSNMMETHRLLEELIELRNKYGLPNDGRCHECPGDRCDS